VNTKRGGAPLNLRSLETRIGNIAREQGRPVRRVQRAVANTVIGQMLPPGVVKGGTAIKLRVGEHASRFTLDFDAARDADVELDEYLDQFANTTVTLYGPRPFDEMNREDRSRAVYLCACLQYVDGLEISNATFRDRFRSLILRRFRGC
jgi:hypothetical protein